jgi:hypothetical protein
VVGLVVDVTHVERRHLVGVDVDGRELVVAYLE